MLPPRFVRACVHWLHPSFICLPADSNSPQGIDPGYTSSIPMIDSTSPRPVAVSRLALVSLLVVLLLACARTSSDTPVQLVVVSRDGAPALAVFHEPDVRINALSVPALEFDQGDTVRFERGTWTADSLY